MATPAEIQANSNCFSCLSDPLSALLYVFNQIRIAGGGSAMTVQEIESASACYGCISDKPAALLMLANTIAINGGTGGGGSGSGSVVPLTGSNVPTPAQAPASGGGVAYNEVPNVWVWNATSGAWDQII
jgi:hypothetical protein